MSDTKPVTCPAGSEPVGAPRPAHARARLVAALALAALGLAACKVPTFGTFTPVTSQERDAYHLYQGLTIAAIVVGAFVWLLIFWCVVRYRRRRKDDQAKLPKQTRQNIPWEIAYTVVPLLVVAGIFGYTVIAENAATNLSAHPGLSVNVTAFQWGWKFHYANTDVTVLPGYSSKPVAGAVEGEAGGSQVVTYPQLVLPLGETVAIKLVSKDVVHGFYVPAFEFSRYAQPGVVNRFDFTPNKTGTFSGRCTQFCGLYHAEMIFSVKVVPRATFATWLANQEKKAASA